MLTRICSLLYDCPGADAACSRSGAMRKAAQGRALQEEAARLLEGAATTEILGTILATACMLLAPCAKAAQLEGCACCWHLLQACC